MLRNRRFIVRLVAVFAMMSFALAPEASGAARPGAVHSAVAEFSAARNPNGTWSYLAGGSLLDSVNKGCDALGLGCRWNGVPECNSAIVGASKSGRPVSFLTVRLPADHLIMDPEGVANVTVRWTAPTSGSFEIRGDFLGVDTSERSHPVAILSNAAQIYSNTVSLLGQRRAFDLKRQLSQGDTIDFVVSTGSACSYLSTGLKAIVTSLASAGGAAMPNLTGQWECRGAPCGSGVAKIQQLGNVLKLTNEKGMVSRGHFAARNVIVADDWEGGLRGMASYDFKIIRWSNPTTWVRVSGGSASSTGGGPSSGGLAPMPGGPPANFKPCYANAGAYAAAGPCFGPAGTTIAVALLRPMANPPAQLVFRAAVANGVPAEVTAALTGGGNAFSVSAPPQLCTGPTVPHKWMIWLQDSSGALQGEIGEFTMTGC